MLQYVSPHLGKRGCNSTKDTASIIPFSKIQGADFWFLSPLGLCCPTISQDCVDFTTQRSYQVVTISQWNTDGRCRYLVAKVTVMGHSICSPKIVRALIRSDYCLKMNRLNIVEDNRFLYGVITLIPWLHGIRVHDLCMKVCAIYAWRKLHTPSISRCLVE